MPYAVLDLGTNTFNLLIAEKTTNFNFKVLLNTKEAVKLGEGGINNKLITDTAFARGIQAIGRHMELIKSYGVDNIKAFATSAIRDAVNGEKFAAEIKKQFGLEIEIISGEKEALLIYKGVKQTLSKPFKRFLILDIGGGSNEFILADGNGIFWKKSYPLGMARLLDKFKPKDPITMEEISEIEAYLSISLPDLFEKVNSFSPEMFIGASGSFDSLVNLLMAEDKLVDKQGNNFHAISIVHFDYIYQKLILSTRQEREEMNVLEPVRKEMIVLACIFVNFILKQFKFDILYHSSNSLKEGAMSEMAID